MSNMNAAPHHVVPKEFPELAMLAWNRDVARAIPAEEAFALYEANWRHVDVGRMVPAEVELVKVLAREYGRGHLMVA